MWWFHTRTDLWWFTIRQICKALVPSVRCHHRGWWRGFLTYKGQQVPTVQALKAASGVASEDQLKGYSGSQL